MDPEAENGKEPEIVFTHSMEGIGLALQGWSNVHYRLRRLGLQRQSRWVEPEDVVVCRRKPRFFPWYS
jgi:hypothetical protein